MRTFQNILFCTDFSEHADFAFDFALGLAARAPGAALHLLHVLPEPAAQFWRGYVSEVENVEEKARGEIAARFASCQDRAGATALQTAVCFGKPAEEIVAHAKSAGIDLILLGRRVQGSLFSGKTLSHVAKHAPCPVLVVPLDFKNRVAGGAA